MNTMHIPQGLGQAYKANQAAMAEGAGRPPAVAYPGDPLRGRTQGCAPRPTRRTLHLWASFAALWTLIWASVALFSWLALG